MGCFGSDFKEGTPDFTAMQREDTLDMGSRSCAMLKEAFYLARNENGQCSQESFNANWTTLFTLGLQGAIPTVSIGDNTAEEALHQ